MPSPKTELVPTTGRSPCGPHLKWVTCLTERARAGFSLMELLVTGVIGLVLVTVLVFYANKLYDRSTEATCARNLQQIGVAFRLMLNDRDRIYPPCGDPWYNHLRSYLGVDPTKSISVTRPEVLRCPKNALHQWNYDRLSYGYNAYLGNNDTQGSWRVRDLAIVSPSQLILCADSDNRQETHNSQIGYTWRTPGVLHRGGANFLFVDGHVEWRLHSEVTASQGHYTEELTRMWGGHGGYAKP